jgi:transposase
VERADLEREQDIEELRRIALAQQAQIQQLMEVVARKSRELDKLRGKSGDLQLTLKMLEELQQKAAKTQAALAKASQPKPAPRPPTPRTSTGPTPQPQLPVIEQVFTLDDADRACTSCGGELKPMKDQFEESELVDVVEVSYRIVKVKRQKYVCRCGGCVDTALGPPRAMPGSRYSLAFAIKVAIDKWLDHLPLERQVRILARHGLVVTSSTLWGLAYELARRLSCVSDALLAHVKAQPVIGLDQTGWPRLDSSASKPWQMWCLTAPGVVVHRIRDDKSAATFRALVGDYTGTIVADALATHEAGAREGPGITLAGCWAHVVRRFQDAKPDHPDAADALRWIAALYDIDTRGHGDLVRLGELRRAEAPAILAQLRAWLLARAGSTHVSIGKAAAYTLGIWERLTRFVEDARIPLDNNATERAIRGPVVGRKNHYGSKSRSSTEVAATLYSILETAKLHHVEPAAYLAAALEAAERGETLLPWQFAPAR